jgi:hypothetical protein
MLIKLFKSKSKAKDLTMAKCIKMFDGKYAGNRIRVPDSYARKLVAYNRAEYSAKEPWKTQGEGRLEPKGRV